MAASAGKSAWVMITGVNGGGTNVSQYSDNFSFPQPTDQLDVSGFGTNAKQFIPGLTQGGQIKVGGAFDTVLYSIVTGLQAGQAAGSSVGTVTYSPAGSVAASAKQVAQFYVAEFSTDSTVAGRNDWSASLQVTGAVTNTTW